MSIKSLSTNSVSPTISSISYSPIFSPMDIIACLKSLTYILPSWSESNTLSASIRSYNVSLSFPLAYITSSKIVRLKLPELLGSTFYYISCISVSVGLRFRARTRVPNSLVATWPRLLLSNNAKISLISLDYLWFSPRWGSRSEITS